MKDSLEARFPGLLYHAPAELHRKLKNRNDLLRGDKARWEKLCRAIDAAGTDPTDQRRAIYRYFVDTDAEEADHFGMYLEQGGYAHDVSLAARAAEEVESAFWYVRRLLPERVRIGCETIPLLSLTERPEEVRGASDVLRLIRLARTRGNGMDARQKRFFAFQKLKLLQFEFERLREGLGPDDLAERERRLRRRIVSWICEPGSERRVAVRAELDPSRGRFCKSWRIVDRPETPTETPLLRDIPTTAYKLRNLGYDVIFESRIKQRVCLKALLKGERFARDIVDLIAMRFVARRQERDALVDRLRGAVAACNGQVIDQNSNHDEVGARVDAKNAESSVDYRVLSYTLLIWGFKHEVKIAHMEDWINGECAEGVKHSHYKIRRLRKIADVLFPEALTRIPWTDDRLWEAILAFHP